MSEPMSCRQGCGMCCIAPSINNPIPGMPNGKPAGVMCVNLDPSSYQCRIWNTPEYPDVCKGFTPEPAVCGDSREEAERIISDLEVITGP